ncbi:hypothetical protein HYQ63_17645 [Streptomyces sp. Rer75]|nr:hypothetical protein HYQ63_17645 [Streptomyces sp. Rer75]
MSGMRARVNGVGVGRGWCGGGAGVDEFEAQPGGEGGRCGAGGPGGADAGLDAVGVADPQRGGAAARMARAAVGGAGGGVGRVVVVRPEVAPGGPHPGAGGTGAHLEATAEVVGGVVPDGADEGEGGYVAGGEPPVAAGCGHAPVEWEAERAQGQRLGSAHEVGAVGPGLCGTQGGREGEGGGAHDADR